jgi:hypothetical protein
MPSSRASPLPFQLPPILGVPPLKSQEAPASLICTPTQSAPSRHHPHIAASGQIGQPAPPPGSPGKPSLGQQVRPARPSWTPSRLGRPLPPPCSSSSSRHYLARSTYRVAPGAPGRDVPCPVGTEPPGTQPVPSPAGHAAARCAPLHVRTRPRHDLTTSPPRYHTASAPGHITTSVLRHLPTSGPRHIST